MHRGVFEESREIMIHIRGDHIHDSFFSSVTFSAFDGHLLKLQDVWMRQHFEEFDLSQSRNWEPILFIVHQDFLQSYNIARPG